MRWPLALGILLVLPLAGAGPYIVDPSSCTPGAEFNFVKEEVQINEFAGTFDIEITRSGTTTMIDCEEEIFVRMLPHDKRLPATSGQDYKQQYIPVTFEAQQKSGNVTIIIHDDAIDEDTEWFLLELDHFDDDAIGPRDEVEVQIIDDKGGFAFALPSHKIPFGGTEASVRVDRLGETVDAISATATLTQQSSNSSQPPRTITYTVSFGPGGTFTTLNVLLNASDDYEPRATLALSSPSPSGSTFLGQPSSMLIAIARDPSLPDPDGATVSYSESVYRVSETEGGVIIDVERSGNTSRMFTVNYTADAGTAGSDDFSAASGTMTFNPGQSRKTFVVAITDDDLAEGPESIWLRLFGAVNADLGDAAASVIVIQDDESPAVGSASGGSGSGGGTTETTTTTTTPVEEAPWPGLFVLSLLVLVAAYRRR